MDYVYTCRPGDNEELRYSIRSVVENMPEGNIWVVGGKPDWYTGNFIYVPQTGSKYQNVRRSLETICGASQISKDFVLMNDDFFIINKIDKVETLHGGPLINKLNAYEDLSPKSGYTMMIEETYLSLLKMGIEEPLDYELHVPMIMNRRALRRVLKDPMLWRSAYGNQYCVGGEKMNDVKYYARGPLTNRSPNIKNVKTDYLSSEDKSFEVLLKTILGRKFNKPSQYELDSSASFLELPSVQQMHLQPL
jgi:hypothetical protein